MTDTDSSTGFDGATLITAGLAVISTVTGLVGAFTGVVPRLIRNHSGYLVITVVLVLIAVALTFAASEIPQLPPQSATISKPSLYLRIGLSAAGLVAFGIATCVLVVGVNKSIGSGDEPRLASSWTLATGQPPVLAVTMQLDDVKANETVYISVTPLGLSVARSVYRSQTGADADGNADEKFDVVLPAKATGLQVVASVGHPETCQGSTFPTLIVPAASGAGAKNSQVLNNPTPSSEVTSAGVAPPVIAVPHRAALDFSCIQVIAPTIPKTSRTA